MLSIGIFYAKKITFLLIAEGGANIFGVFRLKNHDFTPKNHIFSNCRGRRENFWGISCGKSRFYAKKIIFFPILGGRGAILLFYTANNVKNKTIPHCRNNSNNQ
jgi:hypothetical protein